MGISSVYLSVFAAQIGFMMSSASVTWTSPMLARFNQTDHDNPLGRIITHKENVILASLPMLAAAIGAPTFGFISKVWGRRKTLILLGFPLTIAYFVMAFAKVILLFFIARFLAGLTLGGVSMVLPMYCGELASPKNRGILTTANAVFINIGMLLSFCIGPYTTVLCFHIILAVLSLIYIPLVYIFSLESPFYLIQSDYTQAESVLKKLRGTYYEPRELEEIKEYVESTYGISVKHVLKDKSARKSLAIGFGLITFLMLTGNAPVVAYCQSLFDTSKDSIVSPEMSSILVGVAQLLTTVVVSPIADNFPRKLLLSISYFGVGTVLVPFGLYFVLDAKDVDLSGFSWMPLVCFVLYVSVYNIGIGPLLFVFIGELFSPQIKEAAISCMVVYQWAASFLMTALFKSLSALIGQGYLFWIFAVFSFSAILFIKFVVVETKGKSLKEIQDAL
ncbi:hypothetical protein HHI36_010702 [Cryptolaemus montrouzieri]|uniref:Major facilitator superfamily (MFS) profile domain-containing protein n=1 Tax=Cryptolaemus montrouzieri TaxID=559131 RepID=A0ABD2MJM2_9CUCU